MRVKAAPIIKGGIRNLDIELFVRLSNFSLQVLHKHFRTILSS